MNIEIEDSKIEVKKEKFKGILAPLILSTEHAVYNSFIIARDLFDTIPDVMSAVSGQDISPKPNQINPNGITSKFVNSCAEFCRDLMDICEDFFIHEYNGGLYRDEKNDIIEQSEELDYE